MAEDKKSVLLYCDLIHTVEKLDNNTAGELFKHYLRYINDLDPKTDNVLVDLVFEPIKQNLKRDLKKWNEKLGKRSEAGKKSAAKKQFEKWLKDNPSVHKISKDDHLFEKGRCEKYRNESEINSLDWFYYEYCVEFHYQQSKKSTNVESVEQSLTNPTVNDTVTVTVNDIVTVKDIIKKENTFNFRKSLLDYGFKENLVNDWLIVRKKKKSSNTETAFNGFIKQVEYSDLDLNLILTECINRSWSRFKNEWIQKHNSFKSEKKDAGEILLEKFGID